MHMYKYVSIIAEIRSYQERCVNQNLASNVIYNRHKL